MIRFRDRTFSLLTLFAPMTGIAAGSAVWFSAEYTAFAILRVLSKDAYLCIFFRDEESVRRQQREFAPYKNAQMGLARSRFVLDAALHWQGIEQLPAVRAEKDPLAWVESRLAVDFPGDGEIMRIAFSHANAETAAAITNAVEMAYMRDVVDAERRRRMDRLSTLEKLFNHAEKGFQLKQTDLERLSDSLEAGDENALSAQQELSQLEKLRTDLEKEIDAQRIELRFPSRVIELQPADIPLAKNMDGRLGKSLGSALLSFLLPFLAVWPWRVRKRSRAPSHREPSVCALP